MADLEKMPIANENELYFIVFCIESLAERLQITGAQALRMLRDAGDLIGGYLVPCYDVLHTQGKEYLTNDLVDILAERGFVA